LIKRVKSNIFIKIRHKIKNSKYKFTIIFILLYIIICILQKYILLKNEENIKKNIYSNEMIYKGINILKSKLIKDFLSKVSDNFKSDKESEKEKFNIYYYLPEYSNIPKIQSELRIKFFEEVSKRKNKTITQLDTFFLSRQLKFGNSLISINNCIFFCEIVGCHQIILNNRHLKRRYLFKMPLYIGKLNITIIQSSNVDCNDDKVLCFNEISWVIFYPRIIKPQIRVNLIKNAILKNLPDVKIERDSLYIHIRGGDIFKAPFVSHYGQPPFCFYDKIIKSIQFKNIYIISQDKKNVVIKALIRKYKNIIFNKHNLEYDLSLLSHAFNIVLSVSSFAISSIKLNDNLKDLWEYDIMRLSEKFLFLHHHVFKSNKKYIIHTMNPSFEYSSRMFSWKGTLDQIELMLHDKCPYDFVITEHNSI